MRKESRLAVSILGVYFPLTIALLFAIVVVGCLNESSSKSSARKQYAQMERALQSVQTNALDLPFDQFADRVAIGNAPFDELYSNEPGEIRRVYHFPGFALDIDLKRRDGELFVDWSMLPALYWDGLTREQRMAKYNRGLSDYFEQKQRALEEGLRTNKVN